MEQVRIDIEGDLGTLRWWGASWGAPMCQPEAKVEVPLGKICHGGCDLPINLNQQGVGIPIVDVTLLPDYGVLWRDGMPYGHYHLACFLRLLGL